MRSERYSSVILLGSKKYCQIILQLAGSKVRIVSNQAFASSKCQISMDDISGFNSAFKSKVIETLSKRGYTVTKKEINEDERFLLKIRYAYSYSNPINKFVESNSIIETPQGRPYSSYDKSHGGSILNSSIDEGPSIISSIKGLPKCSKLLTDMNVEEE